MTTFPVVLQEWLESESGWGQRPDGYTVHLSVDDSKTFVENYWAEVRRRNPSGVTPECYSRPYGDPFVKDVEKGVYNRLKKLKKEGKFGFRIIKLAELDTTAEKRAKEKAEKERQAKIRAEKERKEKLRKNALAKLTEEEKAVLGLNEKSKPARVPNRGWQSFKINW